MPPGHVAAALEHHHVRERIRVLEDHVVLESRFFVRVGLERAPRHGIACSRRADDGVLAESPANERNRPAAPAVGHSQPLFAANDEVAGEDRPAAQHLVFLLISGDPQIGRRVLAHRIEQVFAPGKDVVGKDRIISLVHAAVPV